MTQPEQKLRTTTSREVELVRGPLLSSAFPLKFPSGRSFTSIKGLCVKCSREILDEDQHGIVSWPLPTVAVIEAVGYCQHCELLSPLNYRLHDDGRFSGLKGGKWEQWEMKPVDNIIVRAIKRLFRR